MPFQLGLALAHVPGWCRELASYLKPRHIARASR
jgi:hypothetical protein